MEILFKNNYYSKIPKIIEDCYIKEKKYIVLSKVEGSRLSDIFLEITNQKLRNNYLIKYGQELAEIHNTPSHLFSNAKQRSINDYPIETDIKKFDSTILPYINYLIKNKHGINFDTFIHGDFHYANILWEKEIVSGVLDWEYSWF